MARRQTGMGMMARWALHLVLAYVLLAQTVLTGIAATQHELAAAAGVFCEGQVQDGSRPSGDGERHDGLCCQLGCAAAAGPALLDPPAGAQLDRPPAQSVRIGRPAADTAAPARIHLSFAARGPPARG